MSALCNIPKTKLNCTHCDLKGSYTTSACIKKKKVNKEKDGLKENDKKKDDLKKDPPPPREPSNTIKRTNPTSFRGNCPSSQESFHNVCVQLRLKEEMDSEDTDSDNESYTTPPESNQEDNNKEIITIEEVDPIYAYTAELTEDESKLDISEDNNSELDEILNNPSNHTTVEIGNLLNLPDILGEDDPVATAKCTPISRGRVSNQT